MATIILLNSQELKLIPRTSNPSKSNAFVAQESSIFMKSPVRSKVMAQTAQEI